MTKKNNDPHAHIQSVLIHGPVGSGKTFVAESMRLMYLARNPDCRVEIMEGDNEIRALTRKLKRAAKSGKRLPIDHLILIANETPYAEDLARAGFVIETRANPRPAQ